MNYSLFIARRLLKQKTGRLSRPVVKVATAAIALGVAVMIISVSVGTGFKKEVRDKIIGFGTHLQLVSYDFNRSYETNPINVDSSLCERLLHVDGVNSIQPFIVKPGIIKTDDAIQGVALKGVDGSYDWTFISSVMEDGGHLHIVPDSTSSGIVLSRRLADMLKLSVNDPVRMYFIQNEKIRARRFTLEGIFDSHFPEFDEKMAFVDMRQLAKLNGWNDNQISGYEVLLSDFDIMNRVAGDVGYITSGYVSKDDSFIRVQSITELQPQIFGWLSLLDMNIVVILSLIIAVAGLNMISGLLILILENTNTIGILKAMGTPNADVRKVFVYMAIYIIGRGMIIGNVVGIALCLLQKYTGLVALDPENYYLDTVPMLISPLTIVMLNFGTLALTTLMLVGPSYIVSKITPAKSIRFN